MVTLTCLLRKAHILHFAADSHVLYVNKYSAYITISKGLYILIQYSYMVFLDKLIYESLHYTGSLWIIKVPVHLITHNSNNFQFNVICN